MLVPFSSDLIDYLDRIITAIITSDRRVSGGLLCRSSSSGDYSLEPEETEISVQTARTL